MAESGFVIVGAAKSGRAALYELLERLIGVFVTSPRGLVSEKLAALINSCCKIGLSI